MGAGVAELKEQLAAVNEQLATAALPKRAELLAQKEALEAELKAAQAKKSADSAAAGAYGLFCSFFRAPLLFPPRLPLHAHLALHLTHTHFDASPRPPFLQRRRPTRRRPPKWQRLLRPRRRSCCSWTSCAPWSCG